MFYFWLVLWLMSGWFFMGLLLMYDPEVYVVRREHLLQCFIFGFGGPIVLIAMFLYFLTKVNWKKEVYTKHSRWNDN